MTIGQNKSKPIVLVLMPFSDDFKDIYESGIKSACKDMGVVVERVDEQIYDQSMLRQIYDQIYRADIIVADMTGRNPNVFYEVGYAHALQKRVILLTQHSQDIPFNLKHYQHLIYEGDSHLLRQQLKRKLKWSIKHPKKRLSTAELEHKINELKNDIHYLKLISEAPMVRMDDN
jgi:nucleoside 2-deoxyribosyltransferase